MMTWKLFSVLLISTLLVKCLYSQESGEGEDEGMSCSLKKFIVDLHNELRLRVAQGRVGRQPRAGNMQMMIWDDHLEKIAQERAEGLRFSDQYTITAESLGQNYQQYYPDPEEKDFEKVWRWVIETVWFSESESFNFDSEVDRKHYLSYSYQQLVWATTNRVGCASHTFSDELNQYGQPRSTAVCFYAPVGTPGDYPYVPGTGCENLCCNGNEDCDTHKLPTGDIYGETCDHRLNIVFNVTIFIASENQ